MDMSGIVNTDELKSYVKLVKVPMGTCEDDL